MAGVDTIRATRDGDQFHYHWAARQSLRLLPGPDDLVAVTVEGASVLDEDGPAGQAGDEIIDVGLYHGADTFAKARQVEYVQLKHSTARSGRVWTPSELKHTIAGFADVFRKHLRKGKSAVASGRLRFRFTSNRPFDAKTLLAVRELGEGRTATHSTLARKFTGFCGLAGEDLRLFYSLITLDGSAPDLWAQRNLLVQDVRAYLPETDYDAPTQLKELVTRKATSEGATNRAISLHDVLRALRATLPDLYPAPSRIPDPADTFSRAQEPDILQTVLSAERPVLIHADGGVGKSVLAARLARAMPTGSAAVLYDCYGEGLYGVANDFRHRHRDALVQIVNELAGRGLCHPLVPAHYADPKQYVRAFVYRLEQAVRQLRGSDPAAVLCVIVDAADNAEMAASDRGDGHSFARDLIRLPPIEGVRLVFTSRTHRKAYLKPPPETIEVELRPFTFGETGHHLRTRYPEATDTEIAQFGHLSSHNPRVQALALADDRPLAETLRALGPQPTTIDAAIGGLLETAIAGIRDRADAIEQSQIERICVGLATLRPLVPIRILAALSGVAEGAIRSFALDLGRPLLITGDSVQFRDEPVETWFRERFKPPRGQLRAYVETLRPIAETSAYVASILPELLLEGGFYDELVDLALSGAGLPVDNPMERRDVELQRLIFALKASLKTGRWKEAAKLALKAAGETAGEGRHTTLIQANTDLASALLAPDRIEEIVARRTFGADWLGSAHAYEAGLMAGHETLQADAASRLRMAMDWLRNWARQPHEEGEREETVDDADRLELAYAQLRLNGPAAAARFARAWHAREVSWLIGAALARRLIDLGRYDDVHALAGAARNNIWLLLALARELRAVGRRLEAAPLARLLKLLASPRVLLEERPDNWHDPWPMLSGVVAAVETAALTRALEPERLADILERYLPTEPPHDLSTHYSRSRPVLVRAYALAAALRERPLKASDLARSTLRKELERVGGGHSQEARRFMLGVGGLLPWAQLSAEVALGRVAEADLADRIAQARAASKKAAANIYSDDREGPNDVAREWLGLLCRFQVKDDALFEAFHGWATDQAAHLHIATATDAVRLLARTEGREASAYVYAGRARQGLEAIRDDAATQGEEYVALARAVFVLNRPEADAYFSRAIEISGRIGEENIARWDALVRLARAAEDPDTARPETAYAFARAGELIYGYMARDKYFDWDGTVQALAGLAPSSVLAILGRWQDRRFGARDRLLPVAIDALVSRGRLASADALALAGFDARWNRLAQLEAFLEAGPDADARAAGVEVAFRYLRVSPPSQTQRDALDRLATRFGLDGAALRWPPPEPTPETPAPTEGRFGLPADRREPDWPVIFQGADPASPDALHLAFARMKGFGPPFERERFYREAAARVSPGAEADFISAAGASPDFHIYDLDYLLRALPDGWLDILAVSKALKAVVIEVCRESPDRVRLDPMMSTLPLSRLEAAGVVTSDEVIDATLQGFTERVDALGAESLFASIHFLAHELAPDDADEAVCFGVQLLDDLLREEDADGAWSEAIAPPSEVAASLAGYVWATLGSPIAAVRWEGAHVVRALVELDRRAVLDALLELAAAGEGGPFVDAGLPFYALHARQWLLVGLVRAARDRAAPSLQGTVALLTEWSGDDHVLIRGLSADLLLELARTGSLTLEAGEAERLARVNVSPWPNAGPFNWAREPAAEADDDAPPEEKYYFGLDSEKYWFAPLGRCFGLGAEAIEVRARRIVRDRFGVGGRTGWRDDARHARGVFQERETFHSQGMVAKTDDLKDYHGYHALMVVAGQLLAERPVHRDDDAAQDDFTVWLRQEGLARRDGRWLADKRDTPVWPPFDTPEGYRNAEWLWSVSRARLDRLAQTDLPFLAVWGEWSAVSDQYRERVVIRSALAPRAGSAALLTALQLSGEFREYALPGAENDPVGRGELVLEGWIVDERRSEGLDERDDWGEAVISPGPRPAPSIIEKFGLAGDADGREWRTPEGDLALKATSWTTVTGWGQERDAVPGCHLSASRDYLGHLVRTTGQDLVVSVSVRRTLDRSAYAREPDDFVEYPWPYMRIYLVRPDGLHTL